MQILHEIQDDDRTVGRIKLNFPLSLSFHSHFSSHCMKLTDYGKNSRSSSSSSSKI
jgi:hypothetical protein